MDKHPEVDVESKWSSTKDKYMSVKNCCIQQKNVNLSKPEQPKWFNKDSAKEIGERQSTQAVKAISHTGKHQIS